MSRGKKGVFKGKSRRDVPKRKDKRMFTKTASFQHAKNGVMNVMRGGIRL